MLAAVIPPTVPNTQNPNPPDISPPQPFPFRETSPWLSRYTTSADETIYIQHSRLQTVSEIFFWGVEDEGGLMVRNIFFCFREMGWDGKGESEGGGGKEDGWLSWYDFQTINSNDSISCS